ncbi:DUF222 domain-containing protein, partial [Galbitalea sp. SE-J8]|uniref:HNH endonuclease signature motif containing protein n=1 Tax=Galbitalea sp. SE-J8 TaxID=3054952 RepID=UPI00259CD575
LVRLARNADRGELFPTRRAAVTVHVRARDLRDGTGFAWIEDTTASVSTVTAERIACTDGSVAVRFDTSGQPIDLGTEQRTFTPAQRRALAARDGGCIIEGCTAPPAMCEAHHTNEHKLDNGRTDIADGVLLCRFHHQWTHANHYRTQRRHTSTYELVARDPHTTPPPITLRSQNPITHHTP